MLLNYKNRADSLSAARRGKGVSRYTNAALRNKKVYDNYFYDNHYYNAFFSLRKSCLIFALILLSLD